MWGVIRPLREYRLPKRVNKTQRPQAAQQLTDLRPRSTAAQRRMVSRTRRPAPSRQWPPGYFSEPVRAWTQMQFSSAEWAQRRVDEARARGEAPQTHNEAALREASTRERERQVLTGTGWGSGTLVMPGTPAMRPNPKAWLVMPPRKSGEGA